MFNHSLSLQYALKCIATLRCIAGLFLGEFVLWMQTIEEYASLLDDLSASAKRWQEWVEIERPEEDPLPGWLILHSIYFVHFSCFLAFKSIYYPQVHPGLPCTR